MNQAEWISVVGAREHNLKNVNVCIPKNKLVVITGVSGSGKSSLAFDTIFSEGQRRYVESLSAYARQFLGQVDKPDVDSIDGLSPAIAIDQKSTHNNPRSTVGTVTEIYDHLRLLYGRVGRQHCPVCAAPVSRQTIDQIIAQIYASCEGERGLILAPLAEGKKGEYQSLFARLKREGFLRVRVNGEIFSLEDDTQIKLAKNKKHNIEIVVDRIAVTAENRSRLADSLSLALKQGGGFAKFATVDAKGANVRDTLFSEQLACPNGHGSLPALTPKLFSFNSPEGACSACHGLGMHSEFDPSKIVPDPAAPLHRCIAPWAKSSTTYYVQLIASLCKGYGAKLQTKWQDAPQALRDALLFGTEQDVELTYDSFDGTEVLNVIAPFEGVIPRLKRKYKDLKQDRLKAELEEYMTQSVCSECGGAKLRPESRAVKVGGLSILEVTTMDIDDAAAFFEGLTDRLSKQESQIAERLIQEIQSRLAFLCDVGLGYLTLGRQASTLSGGESQRIRLATQIGSGLTGVLYVLDEPSIGLHQRDNDRLIATLERLRNLGNTVLVVEHDEDTIRQADWVVDVGPRAGREGGEIVAVGTLNDICAEARSITGQYLSGQFVIPVPSVRRTSNGSVLTMRGAKLHNLRGVDVDIPLGNMVVVTGVSGSGKSTLIMELLLPYIRAHLSRNVRKPTGVDSVTGLENIDKVIEIDQSPIGRTPHSNPATYIGAFTPIRELFAGSPDAKMRGYGPGTFSFNVKGGRCEACSGQGHLEIEMNFLPSVYVKCDVCQGSRYNRETLTVKYRGNTIADVLNMTIQQAVKTFEAIPSVYNKLKTLEDVGLGYIQLGQSATTLSGGEAQRVKLASELCKRQTGKTLYILDEPTTGLHWYDVAKLLEVLNHLVEAGNTVLIIEHNLDVIKQADWIIDLGPEGGNQGGEIVVTGTPENVAKTANSHTGKYLAKVLNQSKQYDSGNLTKR